MTLLGDWLQRLQDEIDGNKQIRISHHRVIHPGSEPLRAEGFVRFQDVGPSPRPGLPPEAMALMSLFVPEDVSNNLPATTDIARALGAHLTFLADRRIEVLAEIPTAMEDQAERVTFLPLSGFPDRVLLAPLDPDEQPPLVERLEQHLSRIRGIDGDAADAIDAAIDLHYGACRLLDADLASAHTLIVAGIETLSREFGSPPSDWESWDAAARWDRFCATASLSSDQAEALRDELMTDRQIRLGETFATYASERLPDEWWNEAWTDWVYEVEMPAGTFRGGAWQGRNIADAVPQDRRELKQALKRSYNNRSGFVHQGSRRVTLAREFALRTSVPPTDLSFSALRLLLRSLIAAELADHAADAVPLPDLRYRFEEPPTGDESS